MDFFLNLGNVFADLWNLINWDWAKLWKKKCCTWFKQKIYFARFHFYNIKILKVIKGQGPLEGEVVWMNNIFFGFLVNSRINSLIAKI